MPLLQRAGQYVSTLVGHIPEVSSKHITDQAEEIFLQELLQQDLKLYCRYQTFRIYYYLRKMHFKRVDPFKLQWDVDVVGRPSLVGCYIFSCAEDNQEKEIAYKIEQRANNGNEYVIPIKKLLNEKLNKRLEQTAFDHFSRILDVAITLRIDPITTLQTLLPGTKANLHNLISLTKTYIDHLVENGHAIPFVHPGMDEWVSEVYTQLYADAVQGWNFDAMHGKQFDKYLPTLNAVYNKRICYRFPSISYLLSSKSENAYQKAKLAKREAVKPAFTIHKESRHRSLASIHYLRTLAGGSDFVSKDSEAPQRSKVKFLDLPKQNCVFELNTR